MMRAGLVVLALVSCKKPPDRTAVTPPGALLVERANVDDLRPSLGGVGATTGPFTKIERCNVFTGPELEGPDTEFIIRFEAAPAEVVRISGAPSASSMPTLRNLTIHSGKNTQWAMTAECAGQPYTAQEDHADVSVIVPCSVTITRDNGERKLTTNLSVRANGSIASTRGMTWDVHPCY